MSPLSLFMLPLATLLGGLLLGRLLPNRLLPGTRLRHAAPAVPAPAGRDAAAVAAAQCGALLETAPIALWQLDAHGRTTFANARLARLFGGKAPASLAESGLLLAGPADPTGPLGFPADREVEASLPRAGGGRHPVSLRAVPGIDPGAPGCALALLDIGPLKNAQARLEHLTEHDALTGLSNRAQFGGALAALAGSPAGGALLLIDIDRFSTVNERLGLAAGDRALRHIADRLRSAVRPADLVCRLGEDQFAVLIFEAGGPALPALATRLQAALAVPMLIEGAVLQVSACIGSARAPLDAARPEALLRAADLALRAARQAGSGRYRAFHPELAQAHERQDLLREALSEALAAEPPPGEELWLAYQPQRDFVTGELLGVEALIRWDSQRLGGAISPGELLPVAAAAGMMPAIDAWVLETALRQMAAWDGVAGAPAMVSINISGVGLRDPGFPDAVARALVRHGMAAASLEIEIPEDLAVRDLPEIEATLGALHALGIRLALDDFGSGHSSLPHVVRLPVHRLKLDRSIVSGLPGDNKARAVLNATMAIARDLGIEVIGEGVETRPQAEALRQAGCTLLQGWLVGRPVRAAALLAAAAMPEPAMA